MIQIVYGDDRIKAEQMVRKVLGKDYELIEGVGISLNDLPSIFFGTSLFAEKRNILIKDMGENATMLQKVVDFLETPHNVVIWETKLDGRTAAYKELKEKVKIQEFKLQKPKETEVFDIYKVAKRDGARAVGMLAKIEEKQDPFMFFGLLVSQALKDFERMEGEKEKRVLKELSRIDILMKTTSVPQFLILKSLLLRISSL